jgi:hypothetical protein
VAKMKKLPDELEQQLPQELQLLRLFLEKLEG